jgi:HrpA-like RNA helicase
MKSEIGQYGIVPRWILEAPISDKALRLYAVFSSVYADRESGEAWPNRASLAAWLQAKSKRTVDKALKELEEIGALTIQPRFNSKGDRTSNLYIVRHVKPPVASSGEPPSLPKDATVAHGIAQQEPESVEPDPLNQHTRDLKPVKKSHRKHVYCGQRFCVPDFLHEQFEQQLGNQRDKVDLLGLDGYYATVDNESEGPIADDPLQFLRKRFTADVKTLFGE